MLLRLLRDAFTACSTCTPQLAVGGLHSHSQPGSGQRQSLLPRVLAQALSCWPWPCAGSPAARTNGCRCPRWRLGCQAGAAPPPSGQCRVQRRAGRCLPHLGGRQVRPCPQVPARPRLRLRSVGRRSQGARVACVAVSVRAVRARQSLHCTDLRCMHPGLQPGWRAASEPPPPPPPGRCARATV